MADMTPAQARQWIKKVEKAQAKATKRALKKVQTTVVAKTATKISQLTSLKPSGIKKKMTKKLFAVNNRTLRSTIRIKPYAPNLINFGAKKLKGKKNRRGEVTKRGGVSVKIYGRRQALRGRIFIGNRGRTVFKRTGHARLPIVAVPGPSSPRQFLNTNERMMVALFENTTIERFNIEYERALEFYLSRIS